MQISQSILAIETCEDLQNINLARYQYHTHRGRPHTAIIHFFKETLDRRDLQELGWLDIQLPKNDIRTYGLIL